MARGTWGLQSVHTVLYPPSADPWDRHQIEILVPNIYFFYKT